MSKYRLILSDCDGVLLNWNASFTEWMWDEHSHELHDVTQYNIAKRFNLLSPAGGIDETLGQRLVSEFNQSDNVHDLDPMPGAVRYVKYLYEECGRTFDIITSLDGDPRSTEKRIINLRRHFGHAIKTVHNVDPKIGKSKALQLYRKGHWWIEDHPGNAELGVRIGHKSILIEHPYNNECPPNSKIFYIQSWDYICDQIAADDPDE